MSADRPRGQAKPQSCQISSSQCQPSCPGSLAHAHIWLAHTEYCLQLLCPCKPLFNPQSSYCFSFPPCLTKSLSCPLSLMPPLECVGGTLLLSLPIVPCLHTTRWAGPKTGPYHYNYYYADYFNSFTTNIMYLLSHTYEFQYSNKVALRALSRSYRLLLFHAVSHFQWRINGYTSFSVKQLVDEWRAWRTTNGMWADQWCIKWLVAGIVASDGCFFFQLWGSYMDYSIHPSIILCLSYSILLGELRGGNYPGQATYLSPILEMKNQSLTFTLMTNVTHLALDCGSKERTQGWWIWILTVTEITAASFL